MNLIKTAHIEKSELYHGVSSDEEVTIQIHYDWSDGRRMKWAQAMEDSTPEEPAECDVYDIKVYSMHVWRSVFSIVRPEAIIMIENSILEGLME